MQLLRLPFDDINALSCDILLFMIKMTTVSIATITPAKVKLSTTASPVTALSALEIHVAVMLHCTTEALEIN